MYSFISKVRYSELAEDKKLSLVSIINYFQDCCNFESEEKGVGLKWLSEHKTAWMLANWQIKIEKRPKLGEEIHITTWACGFRRFIGNRNFTLTDKDGEMIAYAFSSWAYVDVNTGKPVEAPQREVDAYGITEPLDREFAKGKIRVPEELTAYEPVTIRKINLDTNHHVNNGQYIALAEEYLPENFQVTGLRAEYKQQAYLGDILIPKAAETPDGYVVIFEDTEGKRMLIAEFAGR